MAARQPNAINAAIELGFVAAAGALGWIGAPIWWLALLAAAMIGYWIWNRRAGLTQLAGMSAAKLVVSAVVSLALILIFLACAYGVGTMIPGGNR